MEEQWGRAAGHGRANGDGSEQWGRAAGHGQANDGGSEQWGRAAGHGRAIDDDSEQWNRAAEQGHASEEMSGQWGAPAGRASGAGRTSADESTPRSASGAAASGADVITERWTISEGQSRVIDLDAVTALRVGIVGGSVDIVGHDEPTTRVEVHHVEGRDLTVALEQGRLSISHPRVSWDDVWESVKALVGVRARVELSIVVPRAMAVSLGQVTASALVTGLRGRASLSSVSGSIQVESHTGDLDLNTVSGDLEVSGGVGGLSVHAVSADVTASGRLDVIGIDTVSGDVLLDLHGAPRSVSANSVSGDVTVRVDAGQGLTATMRTVSGRGSIAGVAMPKRGGREVVAGDNPFDLSASTVSGGVTVVRRQA